MTEWRKDPEFSGAIERATAQRLLLRLERELKAIYRAETAELAAKRLSEFDAGPWGEKYPMIAESWRRNWEHITPFYSYPPEVGKII